MVRPPDNGETCCTMKYGHLGKALALVHLGDEVRMASDESLVYQTFNSKPSFTFGYVDEGHIRILHLTILPRLRNTVHSPQKTSYTSPSRLFMPRSPDKRWPSPSEREDRNRDRRGIGGPSSSSVPLPPSTSSGGRYDSGRYAYNKRDDRRDDRRDERGIGRYDRYEDDRRRGWSGRSGAGEGVRGDYHQDGYIKPVYSREGEIST